MDNYKRKRFYPRNFYLALPVFGVTLFWIYCAFVAVVFSINNYIFTTQVTPWNFSLTNETPICTENLLNAKEYDFTQWATNHDFGNNLIRSRSESLSPTCRLLDYSPELVVKCIDILVNHKESKTNITKKRDNNSQSGSRSGNMLHFVFIGDSRIRQQFFNFMGMIPDYDRVTTPSPIPSRYHDDIEVISELLQLRITFQWRPLLDHQVLTTIKHYLADERLRPDWILLGIGLHHMLAKNNATLPVFLNRVEEIAPVFDQLGQLIKVIWLHQYPSITDYMKNDWGFYNQIFPESIQMYNEAVRPILKRYHNIRLWDSSNKLAEEYIRGCLLIKRGPESGLDYVDAYMPDCDDFNHTGNTALAEVLQLLYNDLCNSHLLGVI